MPVQDVLISDRQAILDEASAALERFNLSHYTKVGPEASRERLAKLFDLVVASVSERDLVPIVDYAASVAEERFAAGVDISEVQCAFNVLEEAIWDHVVAATAPRDLADAIGMVTTVLGSGRNSLARTYVASATKQRVPSLDLTALFRGGY